MPKVRNMRVGGFMLTTVDEGNITVTAHESKADALQAVAVKVTTLYPGVDDIDTTDEATVSAAIGEEDIDFLFQVEEITE